MELLGLDLQMKTTWQRSGQMKARWEKSEVRRGPWAAWSSVRASCHLQPLPVISSGVQRVPGYRVSHSATAIRKEVTSEPGEVTCKSDLTEEEEQQVAK